MMRARLYSQVFDAPAIPTGEQLTEEVERRAREGDTRASASVLADVSDAASLIGTRAAALVPAFSFTLAAIALMLAQDFGNKVLAVLALASAAFGLYRAVVAQLAYTGKRTMIVRDLDVDHDFLAARLAKKLVFAEEASALLGLAILLAVTAALL